MLFADDRGKDSDARLSDGTKTSSIDAVLDRECNSRRDHRVNLSVRPIEQAKTDGNGHGQARPAAAIDVGRGNSALQMKILISLPPPRRALCLRGLFRRAFRVRFSF